MRSRPPDPIPNGLARHTTRRARAVSLASPWLTHPCRAATAKPQIETLLRMRVDGPTDAYQWFGIEAMTLTPGAVQRYGDDLGPGTGDVGFVVQRGTIRFETDGPALFARRGGDILAAGTPLGAGDAVLLEPGDQGSTGPGVVSRRRNVGRDAADTIELALTTIGTPPDSTPGVSYIDLSGEVFPLPGRPGTPSPSLLTLARVTLPPGGQIRARALPALEMLAVESGHLAVVDAANPLVSSGLAEPSRPRRLLGPRSGVSDLKRTLAPATILRNPDATPTVFLAATEETR